MSPIGGVDVYSIVILSFAVVGVVVNIVSLVVLIRKKTSSMFHKLLKVTTDTDYR
jgi:Co/Zn/Cd efflux system component